MVLDEKSIERHYIPQPTLGYQSVVIILIVLFLVTLLQTTIVSKTNKIETSLNNMRNACVLVAEKGTP